MRLTVIIMLALAGVSLVQAPVYAMERHTLSDCIFLALKNQPVLRSARASVNAGQSRVIQAASAYLPQIRVSTGYTEDHSVGGAFGGSITKNYTTSLSVNQMLYDFGKTGNTLEATRLGSRSAEWDEQRITQDVVLNVKQAYFALLQAKKLVTVSQKTLEQAESHLKQANAFFRAGSKPKFDVTRAEVEVNSARLGLINANNSVRIRTITLYNTMGIAPEKDIEIDDILSASANFPPFAEALAEALKNRPDILKIEVDILALRARVRAEKANYLPTLAANGTYNWADGTSEMGLFKGDINNSWNVGVKLMIPLFEGGLTWGKVNEAQANLHTLEAQWDMLRQTVVLEVSQAIADMESATARMSVMETSLKKARESLEIAQERYEAGVGPYIEVTDAQLTSVNAETDHVQTLYDYQLAVARLLKAIGKGAEK